MRKVHEVMAARDVRLARDLPGAAQARCGVGKGELASIFLFEPLFTRLPAGVWALAPPTYWGENIWIEIRDSQWKYEDRQTTSFTFEVHSIPISRSSANIVSFAVSARGRGPLN